MMFVGVDLGKDGAIVCVDDDMKISFISKPPLIKSGKAKPEYDIPGISLIFEGMPEPKMVILEKAQAMPQKMGGASANYGRGLCYGIYQGVLVGLKISHAVVPPKRWQKEMFDGVNAVDTKQASIIVASRLWPGQDWRRSERAKKADDGITDAALIAEYGRRHYSAK
jgi:hypothetical protein